MCKKRIDGVYCWKVNGIVRYVGSGKDITDSRKSNHLAKLRKGSHNKELVKLFNEFGEDAFEFDIIEKCNYSETLIKEKYWKEIYKDTLVSGNNVINTKKKIRTGLKAKKHKEMFRDLMSGENNPNCNKLTAKKVREIKIYQRDNTYRDKELAKMYNVSLALINNIRNGERWSSVKLEEESEKVVPTPIDTTSHIA